MKGNFPLHYMSLLKHSIIALLYYFFIKAPFSSKVVTLFSGIGKTILALFLK